MSPKNATSIDSTHSQTNNFTTIFSPKSSANSKIRFGQRVLRPKSGVVALRPSINQRKEEEQRYTKLGKIITQNEYPCLIKGKRIDVKA